MINRRENNCLSSTKKNNRCFVVVGFLLTISTFMWLTKHVRITVAVSPELAAPAELALKRPTSALAREAVYCLWHKSVLAGKCPGDPLRTTKTVYKSAQECSDACCKDSKCVAWQFRANEGCLHGGDVRLGMEKDGPSDWCEPTAPAAWKGERVLVLQGEPVDRRQAACGSAWNPNMLQGQCFGLGPKRQDNGASDSADACRRACCEDGDCATWQFRSDKGCFYYKVGPDCEAEASYEPFQGKRKVVKGRTYTDQAGKPVPYD